jgi:CBS domain-containing protein
MKHRNVRTLPVCDGDRLVGILTDWDVAQAVADERPPAKRAVAAYTRTD